VHAAHGVGVVHRDIKPQNILMDSETGRPTLIDFGVAVLRTSEHSRSEIKKSWGTPQFMSPEHVLGDPLCDGRSDIYALGVLGFRMLAGKLPFAGPDEAVAARQVAAAAPILRESCPHVPEALAETIQRCLAKDPADRWEDGAALRRALLTRHGSGRGLRGWLTNLVRRLQH
jgi:serine/threonine-protein kinase